MKEKRCGIYLIEHSRTWKDYIGKSVDVEKRMMGNHRGSPEIYKDIKKYGRDEFEERVLHYCKKEELRFFEAFYIRFFQSHVSSGYGYNMNWGSSEYHIDDVIDFDNFDISDVHFPAYYNDVNSRNNLIKRIRKIWKNTILKWINIKKLFAKTPKQFKHILKNYIPLEFLPH